MNKDKLTKVKLFLDDLADLMGNKWIDNKHRIEFKAIYIIVYEELNYPHKLP